MRTSLLHAFTADDPTTLLLLWGARPGSDPADVNVWRAASPYWSDDRRVMIAGKYEKALAGEDDPELDDPDPMRGFEAQYLNVWRLRERRETGQPVVTEHAWAALVGDVPDRAPDAVAAEDWFTQGVSVAWAWHADGRAVVGVTTCDDVAGAAEAVDASGFKGRVLAGASIATDPAWKAAGVRTTPQKGTVRAAVEDLGRLLTDAVLAHDGGAELSSQVLALRTSPGVDGPRLRSTAPADGVKAAVWAALAARKNSTRRAVVVL
jgi:hypothetical protein